MITASVGVGGVNRKGDVRTVQGRLNRFVDRLEIPRLDVDGDYGPKTRAAIIAFQHDVVGLQAPDGLIDPNGRTWRRLDADPRPPATASPPSGKLAELLIAGPLTALTDEDYVAAAATLGCANAAIRAVAKVECARKPFDELGRPTILYERHLFHQLTEGRFDRQPDLSNRGAGGYGAFASQYPKLERAYALDPDAALKACSWGMFQILGINHEAAGFSNVTDYVRAMCQTEADHLRAFVSFIRANPGMHEALKNRDWTGFARRYNGPEFHKNDYDRRMANAFRELGGS